MLKRMAAASEYATIGFIVAIALAGHEAWRSGLDIVAVVLILFAPVAAMLLALLVLGSIPDAMPHPPSLGHAISWPAVHVSFTLMISRMLMTGPNVMVAPHEAATPLIYWLQPRPLILLGITEALIVAVLVSFRRSAARESVSS